MEIVFYYRPKANNQFSIESLFNKFEKSLFLKNIKVRSVWLTGNMVKDFFIVRKNVGDINHITGAVNYIILFLFDRKTVLTVHDIGHYTLTLTGIKKVIYGLINLQLPLLLASKIVYISEYTKRAVEHSFFTRKSQSTVIYNFIDISYNYMNSFGLVPEDEFRILQVGSSYNKNVKGLINACIDIKLKVHLLLVNSCIDEQLRQLIKYYNINVTIHTNISDDYLYKLYRLTDVLYFASFYEGFGLPILEANYFGKPIICSDIEVMREIANDSALFVNPRSTDEIRDAILELQSNKNLYNNLVIQGQINLKKYSLERFSRDYLNIYKSLLL